jgi:hypothetical protein
MKPSCAESFLDYLRDALTFAPEAPSDQVVQLAYPVGLGHYRPVAQQPRGILLQFQVSTGEWSCWSAGDRLVLTRGHVTSMVCRKVKKGGASAWSRLSACSETHCHPSRFVRS